MASAVGLKGLLEKGAGGSTVTETVRHFLKIYNGKKCSSLCKYTLLQYYDMNDSTNLMGKVKSECGLLVLLLEIEVLVCV